VVDFTSPLFNIKLDSEVEFKILRSGSESSSSQGWVLPIDTQEAQQALKGIQPQKRPDHTLNSQEMALTRLTVSYVNDTIRANASRPCDLFIITSTSWTVDNFTPGDCDFLKPLDEALGPEYPRRGRTKERDEKIGARKRVHFVSLGRGVAMSKLQDTFARQLAKTKLGYLRQVLFLTPFVSGIEQVLLLGFHIW